MRHGGAKISDFIGAGPRLQGISGKRDLGRANERILRFIRHDEDDPAVFVLQDVALLALVEAGQDDVAPLDEAEFFTLGRRRWHRSATRRPMVPPH